MDTKEVLLFFFWETIPMRKIPKLVEKVGICGKYLESEIKTKMEGFRRNGEISL